MNRFADHLIPIVLLAWLLTAATVLASLAGALMTNEEGFLRTKDVLKKVGDREGPPSELQTIQGPENDIDNRKAIHGVPSR